jgi:hypothetical protein
MTRPPGPPAPPPASVAVVGLCPMGCGSTLFRAPEGGHITCGHVGCPRPTAVDELLADGETEHIVMLYAATFTVRHPLRERLDEQLLTCDLHQAIADLDGPPRQPGLYRVVVRPGTPWEWTAVDGR